MFCVICDYIEPIMNSDLLHDAGLTFLWSEIRPPPIENLTHSRKYPLPSSLKKKQKIIITF